MKAFGKKFVFYLSTYFSCVRTCLGICIAMRCVKSSEQFAFHSVGSSSGLAINNLSPLSRLPGPKASVQLTVFQRQFETSYRILPVFLVRKLKDVFRKVGFVLAAVAFLFLKGAVLRFT